MAKKKLPNKLRMIVNVVLYLRVSSEEQAKYGFSIDNQRIDCTNFAERNGYHVVKVFTDDGKSAKDLNRPEGLKTIHEKKNDYSEQVKNNLLQQIKILDNRIEQAYNDKLDGIRSYDEWKPLNDKWTAERDKLYIQLNEMNELDKQFYQKTDMLLGFTENVHEYFKKGNFDQRRRILEIISDGITYKDGELNIKLKPVFQSIVENQYISAQKMSNNRNAETGIIKGVEIPSTPLNEKFSPGWTRTNNPSVNSRMLCH